MYSAVIRELDCVASGTRRDTVSWIPCGDDVTSLQLCQSLFCLFPFSFPNGLPPSFLYAVVRFDGHAFYFLIPTVLKETSVLDFGVGVSLGFDSHLTGCHGGEDEIPASCHDSSMCTSLFVRVYERNLGRLCTFTVRCPSFGLFFILFFVR